MSLRLHLLSFLSALCLTPSFVKADDAKPSDADLKFFESRIRPLLASKCVKCHGDEKQEGKLRLDSWNAMQQGGASGPAYVGKQADKSLLMIAVSYRNPDLQMPPDAKLSDVEIADLKRWIELGAPHPDMQKGGAITPRRGKIDFEQARQFWSFKPVTKPTVPSVKSGSWPKTEIDHFILARQEAAGLNPSVAADKRTLIRRASLDLLGLPPTAEEVEAFVADDSPNAFAKVIDRLLDSSHYGERWGRHWLDVARYADSNGLDENIAHGNAWRYRDWAVSAVNRDLPYDQFLTAQVAGDLLPFDDTTSEGRKRRNENLIATSFLAIGPKVLAEVDEVKMEMDIIDEQIDTLGRAALGMTFGCARCHDHKFDPFSMADYYGMAGVFKSTRVMEHYKKIAKWHENAVPTEQDLSAKSQHDDKVAAHKAKIDSVLATAKEKLVASLPADSKLPTDFEKQLPEDTKKELASLRDQLKKLEAEGASLIPMSMGATEGKVTELAIHLRGSHLTLGELVPRRTPELLAHLEQSQFTTDRSGRLELAKWLTSPRNPLTARVFVNRVWRWHFGQGLVRSVDNFGILGEAPSHPELLDWLASDFMSSGWSLKTLHRRIMLSATYQQASGPATDKDPENRLLSHIDVRRLDAESLRDSVLAVSGLLDRTMGGSLLHVKNREFFFDHTSKDTTKYDSRKRTLYLPVVRNHLYDVLQLFDSTDATVSNGDRNSSTVAPQSLFLMNADLMHDAATALANQLVGLPDADDARRLQVLNLMAYGRPITDKEKTRMLSYLDAVTASNAESADAASKRKSAWQSLCHVVLSSNEFLYVR
mgnify:CR=1 FL=1